MSNSNSILMIDPAFDPALASRCHLLIKVGMDSFSYAIIDKTKDQVVAVFDTQECTDGVAQLSSLLQSDPNLGLAYAEKKLAYFTENTITMPTLLFDPEEVEVQTQYFNLPGSDQLHVVAERNLGVTTLLNFPEQAEQLIGSINGRILPFTAGLLALAEKDADALYLDFTVCSFAAVWVKDGQLIFQQTYEIIGLEEFNYYLLLLINQLQLKPEQTVVKLCGLVHEGDERYGCIQKYFQSIGFATSKLDQEAITDLPLYYYTSLLALDQCE
ncbi:MAG: DUF3822 family protein [Pedobacter sp.]|nr:DUF3822 family protein [Pedobacter sp.]